MRVGSAVVVFGIALCDEVRRGGAAAVVLMLWYRGSRESALYPYAAGRPQMLQGGRVVLTAKWRISPCEVQKTLSLLCGNAQYWILYLSVFCGCLTAVVAMVGREGRPAVMKPAVSGPKMVM